MASDEASEKVGDTNHNQSKQVENAEKCAKKKSKKERQKLKKMEEKKRKGSETTKSDDEENTKKSPRIEEQNSPGRMSPKNLSDNERRRLSLSGGLVEKKGEDLNVTATPLLPKTPVLYHKDHNVDKPTILTLDGGHKDNSKKLTKENRTGI